MSALGYFVHDCLAHPVCGLFWVFGSDRFGDWLHDITVFAANEDAERWPRT